MSVAPSYESILRKSLMESGRPLHPAFAHVLEEEWVDPTARDFTKDNGEVIPARERSMMNAISFFTIEGFMGTLTPLGYLMLADAMLGFLAVSPEEIEHGFEGITVDPWDEVKDVPERARVEFGKAQWHIHEALKLMGLDDLGQPSAMPCGCPLGTHNTSISQIGQHHDGNPWTVRDRLLDAEQRGEWRP